MSAISSLSGPRGILAIWNDCAPEGEAEYERWYMEEHLPEGLTVPGFREGRRYDAVHARGDNTDRRYFTFYEVDSPVVLNGAAYVERLNNPTPRTVAAMRYFRGMARTVCDNASDHGWPSGAYAVTLRSAETGQALDAKNIHEALRGLGAVRARVWTAARQQTQATREAKSRAVPDEQIGFAVVIETLRESEAAAVLKRVSETSFLKTLGLSVPPLIGAYRLLCIAGPR